jgi:hypothetical protein
VANAASKGQHSRSRGALGVLGRHYCHVSILNNCLYPVSLNVLFLAEYHIVTRASRLLAFRSCTALAFIKSLQSFGKERVGESLKSIRKSREIWLWLRAVDSSGVLHSQRRAYQSR